MRTLKIFLWVAGIACLLSGYGLFMPVSAWEAIANFFGAESLHLPDSPLFVYVVRVCSAMAVAMGVYLIILALNPMKYPVLIPFTGLASIFIGAACGIAGLAVGMPILWFLGDSLGCLLFGILVLASWQQIKHKKL